MSGCYIRTKLISSKFGGVSDTNAEPHCYGVHIMASADLNIKLDKSCMYIGALAATEPIFKSLISRLNLVVCAKIHLIYIRCII